MNMNICIHTFVFIIIKVERKSLIDFWFLVIISRACLDIELNITQTSIVKQACGNKEYVTGRSVDKWSTTNDLIAHFSACIHLSISTYPPVGVCLSIFLSI